MTKLTRSGLRTHLQRSVQILKRSLDYSASTYFILTMLFLNFSMGISPYTSAHGNIHFLPRSVTQAQVMMMRRKSPNRRDEISEELTLLEAAIPLLKGALLPALNQGTVSDAVLYEFDKNLQKLQQDTDVFSNPERFRIAYDYWIEQLAIMTIRRDVGFYTQRPLARLMINLLKPTEGMSIYDPSVGTGGLLVEAMQYLRQQGGDPRTLRLLGREKSAEIWAICKMNLLVQGIEDATIEQGDTLQTVQADAFDLVIEDLPLFPNSRSGQKAELTFLRHAIASLSPQGRAALLVPSTLLNHNHQEFWRFILSRDWLEAVISLPPKLLHGTSAGATLLMFNKHKREERQLKVLFVQAAPHFVAKSRMNMLPDGDVQRVVAAFETWRNDEHARVVPLHEIENQGNHLNVDRYLEWVETPQTFDVGSALQRYRFAVQKRETAVEELMKTLESLNIDDNAGNPRLA